MASKESVCTGTSEEAGAEEEETLSETLREAADETLPAGMLCEAEEAETLSGGTSREPEAAGEPHPVRRRNAAQTASAESLFSIKSPSFWNA